MNASRMPTVQRPHACDRRPLPSRGRFAAAISCGVAPPLFAVGAAAAEVKNFANTQTLVRDRNGSLRPTKCDRNGKNEVVSNYSVFFVQEEKNYLKERSFPRGFPFKLVNFYFAAF